jgi:anti-sigma factor RsiW
MAKLNMGHRSDEITGYLSETLEPEARAALEAHLDTCEECQDEAAAQRALFDQVNQALAVKPERTIDQQVARFEKMVAAERAQKRRRLRWLIPVRIVLAAALAVVAAPVRRPVQIMAAPRKP